MVGWLAKAKSNFARPVAAEPQPFELICACRNEVRGLRQREYQAVRCTRCGNHLFVLPTSLYPPLRTPPLRKQPGSPAAPATAPPTRSPRTVSPSALPTETRKQRKLKETKPGVDAETVAIPRVPVGQRIRKKAQQARGRAKGILLRAARGPKALFTPFRVVMLAMLAVLAATGYWAWHARAVEHAELSFAAQAQEGEEAFHAGNFALAAEELGKACRALDVLKRDDRRANTIQQLNREATAILHLLPASLLDTVESTRRALERREPNADGAMESRYPDRWIIVQGQLASTVNEDGKRELFVDYPLRVDGHPIVLLAAAEGAASLGSIDEPRPVVLAGKLESCRQGRGARSDIWEVRLDPESLFYWSDFNSLVELGMADESAPKNDPTRQLLSQQAEKLEVER